jgi:spore coat protein U-like protein
MSNISFGTVNLLGGSGVNSSGSVNVNCRNLLGLSLSVRLCVHLGAGSGGMSAPVRTMANGANRLQYQLYQDASRTTSWGAANLPSLGAPHTFDFALLPLSTFTASRTIHARILPNQQTVPGGAYSSAFTGGDVRVNWGTYTLIPPSCSSLTQNPSSPSFAIQSFVDRTCSVSAQNLDFGRHGLLKNRIDAASQLAVSCTSGLPFAISLNGGLTNAAPAERKMTNGTHAITYGLFRDSARSQPWGSATGLLAAGTGSGIVQNLTVYGRVPVQTTPPAGTYSDTVVVTVTY